MSEFSANSFLTGWTSDLLPCLKGAVDQASLQVWLGSLAGDPNQAELPTEFPCQTGSLTQLQMGRASG